MSTPTITLAVTPDELETIIACITQRAAIIGNATRVERNLQEALYRLAAHLEMQANPNQETRPK